MTIGIYRLIFNGTDKCYIGQSINIEYRYKQHINSLLVGKANNKMQEAYVLFGLPILDILCECSSTELDKTETEAIEIFDSVNNGFNILSSADFAPNTKGEKHGRAKYTNTQILDAARLLCCPTNTASKVSSITGIDIGVLKSISSLKNHTWISEVAPDVYDTLLTLKSTRKNYNPLDSQKLGIKHPPIQDPSGFIYTDIPNLSEFCRKNNLDVSSLCKVFRGKYKSTAGWKLAHG